MHMTPSQAVLLADGIKAGVESMISPPDVLLCPPFIALSSVNSRLAGSNIELGAQNMHHMINGAFTGECSSEMLKAVSCSYVLLGHSERRHVFGETDDLINKKILSAFSASICPILCVGEKLEERKAGLTFNVIERQIKLGLNQVTNQQLQNLVIAYEPVWAIGTGQTATPDQAEEVHGAIRALMKELYPAGDSVRILYGGSVKVDNAKDLLSQPDIDGALVGGASLKIDSFLGIIEAA